MPNLAGHTILKGASTVLAPLELLPVGAMIHEWCVAKPGEMNLIYRASRGGFNTTSFRAQCTAEVPATLTLIRVSCDGAAGDSVVRGYSSVAWAGIPENKRGVDSPQAFIFMLKDGTCAQPNSFAPALQSLFNTAGADFSVRATPESGPHFGKNDLCANFTDEGGCTIKTGSRVFRANSSAFLGLNGHEIVDIEVYGVCDEQQLAGNEPKLPCDAEFSRATASDVRLFGEVIARSLTEERVVLQQAFKAMRGAETRVAAASQARRAVYRLDLEADNEQFVVELHVRGTMMTTLRSTLQACPESALAARFDKKKWAVADKDCDERGRRLIDCRPSVFSKVLDALRIRKRESWPQSKEGKAGAVGRGVAKVLVVEEHDRACFEEFVNMYFPGCQSFITDLVAAYHEI